MKVVRKLRVSHLQHVLLLVASGIVERWGVKHKAAFTLRDGFLITHYNSIMIRTSTIACVTATRNSYTNQD
jgi:hypothetical protein